MQRKFLRISLIIAVSLILMLTAGIASAATVTNSISFSGYLTNAADSPLTGTYTVTFRLYNVASGGTALATDTHTVTANKGAYTTTLTFPAELYNGQGLWLGIQRAPDPEKTPRTAFYPVPYALSVRPGAVITGSSGWILKVQNSAGTGLVSITSNDLHPGFLANTSGKNSSGYHAETRGAFSPGLSAITSGIHSAGMHTVTHARYSPGLGTITDGMNSPGVYAETYGNESPGMSVITKGRNSSGVYAETRNSYTPGIHANTSGSNSPGYYAETRGNYAPGLSAYTIGKYSPGVYAETRNSYTSGMHANTTGSNSPAYYAETRGSYAPGLDAWTRNTFSPGVNVNTTGANSPGVWAETSGTRSDGVHAYSKNSVGVYAATGNATHRYGVYTPDKMSALGYDTNSGDVAEFMRVTGEATPGTVLVIGKGGVLRPSATAYDTHVAGVVSTAPGVSLGTKEEGNYGEALVAVAGKVPCNVDASNEPITEGDLLTTSSRQGYAMKAVNPKVGTVLGKAMGSLDSGTGTIEVLVTLQ